ncbi:hypothetical protein H4R23_001028 [Coemansia sp. Cherry 401B]|nr:hypothetical protein H4R23_001028 [Coemansia sp. Cherry 401B]
MTYADLSMIVEAKGSTREQEIAYRQMFRYSRPIYQFQPDRRYLWGLTVCDTDVPRSLRARAAKALRARAAKALRARAVKALRARAAKALRARAVKALRARAVKALRARPSGTYFTAETPSL